MAMICMMAGQYRTAFRKSQLANWRQVDGAVRKLLDSFRQDGKVDKTN